MVLVEIKNCGLEDIIIIIYTDVIAIIIPLKSLS